MVEYNLVCGPRADMVTLTGVVDRMRIPRVDVIKVDVEGPEPLVFWCS